MTEVPAQLGRLVYEPSGSSGVNTVLAGPGLVVVLRGRCSPAVLTRVWQEVSRSDVSLERVVQAIPSLGSDAVTSFAVAALEEGPQTQSLLSVVARGESLVDVHTGDAPPRRFSSQGLLPWHLASFSGVTGLRFGSSAAVGDATQMLTISGSELPLVLGAASASSVVWMLDERFVVVDRPASGRILDNPESGSRRDDAEITLERAPERRRARHGGQPESPRSSMAAPRERPCRVRIGSQAPFELHVPVYIGRRPRGPRQLPGDQVILVEVPSPTREVSASHLSIVQQGREVVVTDLRSTNGTAVTPPGSTRIKLLQGDSIVLPPYSRIEIGDGNVIEILPGAD